MEHKTETTGMKRSDSMLALQECLRKTMSSSDHIDPADPSSDLNHWVQDFTNHGDGGLPESFWWSESLTPTRINLTSTFDSRSSICENLTADSPVSANKPEARGEARRAVSGSSHDNSDVEDAETQAGQSEYSTDPTNIKRLKRMVSNRESAKRSRRRKQEHLIDLETRVEQLKGENSTLYKQLISATHQYRGADTSNRFLKSDVETLRVKVKLAEDLIARGPLSITSGFNQLLESPISHLQPINNLRFPAVTVDGDQSRFPAITLSGQNSSLRLGNIASDAVSCVSDIWP